jgi:hypothetical protein
MATKERYKVQYPVSAYIFLKEARVQGVRFDEEYLHIDLADGRQFSVPLCWIPTLYNAKSEEREKVQISRDRTMLIWDPEVCAINDELRVADDLGPTGTARKL